MCMVHAMKDVVNTYMVTCVPGMYPMSTYDTWIGALNITASMLQHGWWEMSKEFAVPITGAWPSYTSASVET